MIRKTQKSSSRKTFLLACQAKKSIISTGLYIYHHLFALVTFSTRGRNRRGICCSTPNCSRRRRMVERFDRSKQARNGGLCVRLTSFAIVFISTRCNVMHKNSPLGIPLDWCLGDFWISFLPWYQQNVRSVCRIFVVLFGMDEFCKNAANSALSGTFLPLRYHYC